MKHYLLLAALTTIGLTTAADQTNADEKLSLKVTPNVSSAPSTVIVKATVARHADNRWLQVEADSGSFYRSSSIQLDGDNAPTVTEFRFNSLPSGNYNVVAVLRDNAGEETVVRRNLMVLSAYGEPPPDR